MTGRGQAADYRRARYRLRNGRLVRDKRPGGDADSVADRFDEGPAIVRRHGRLVRRVPETTIPETAAPANVGEPIPADEAQVGTKALGKPSALIALFVVTLALPFSWQLGPLRMPPYLIFLAIGFIPMIAIWLGKTRTPIIPSDVLMLLSNLWITLALVISGGIAWTIETIGVTWLTGFGAYLAGRLLVRDVASMQRMVRAAILVTCVMLPAVLIEAFTSTKPILLIAGLIGQPLPAVDIGGRLGLHRAQGAFEHPILMGVFCASMLSIGFYSLRDRKYVVLRHIAAPVATLCSLCSLSTGALLALNLQFGLMLWSRVLRSVKDRWRILVGLLVAAYIAVDMVSTKTPFHVFVNRATFSSKSSYNRILIWEFGTEEVKRHPWFGVGVNDWTRPSYMSDSFDNFWLFQAVKYGLPAFVFLAGAVILILVRMGRAEYRSQDMVLMRRGAMFSIIATCVAISSVHLWNATYVWFMFLIGACAWLGTAGNASRRES